MPTRLSPRTKTKIKKALIAGAILYILFNPYSWRLVKLISEEHRVKKEIALIEDENKNILKDIKRLETDEEYYGYIVRRDLGMIKPNEVEYRFAPSQKKPKP